MHIADIPIEDCFVPRNDAMAILSFLKSEIEHSKFEIKLRPNTQVLVRYRDLIYSANKGRCTQGINFRIS
jgi:hypothetical protein